MPDKLIGIKCEGIKQEIVGVLAKSCGVRRGGG